jgi:hypothetical protein
MSLSAHQNIVKEGTYLYDGTVECDIRITYSPVRYGTGDHEDPPELSEEQECDTYYLHFGSTTERGCFSAFGGGFPSLAEAIAAAERAPGIGASVR